MKKHLVLVALLILLTPCLAFSDMVTFGIGYFFPRANSDLWDTEFENMSFTQSNFNNSIFGFTYEYFFSNQLSLTLSIDGYSQKKIGFYRDFVGISFTEGDFAFPTDFEGEFDISHVFDVSITPIQLSLKLAPMGRRGRFIPYIGGGAGVYLWNVRLQGDIVDFDDVWVYEDVDFETDIFPVVQADAREDNKVSLGFHGFGGIMVPVANRISVDGQFKFNFLKGELSEGFEGFEDFDLSGYQITIGLNYWF